MFSTDDTIVAIATPQGRGALGVVRLSGRDAHEIARRLLGRTRPLPPRRASLGHVRDTAGASLDEVVSVYFPGPRSFTGEDVVELTAHGSPVVLAEIVAAAMAAGARAAGPGEFTLRAFVHGRIDLTRAEAVADLIDAVTPRQARAAFDQLEGSLAAFIASMADRLLDLVAHLEASLDFPEEGYHFSDRDGLCAHLADIDGEIARALEGSAAGRAIREGATVVIAGRPNTGKSSLFNALVGTERAIVAAVPGTTRDLVSESIDLHGAPVRLVDTAGHRDARDVVEAEGVRRAAGARAAAEVVLVVLDRSQPLTADDRDVIASVAGMKVVTVLNKADRPAAWLPHAETLRAPVVETSVVTGEGIDALRAAIVKAVFGAGAVEYPRLTNVRHIELLERAHAALGRAADLARSNAPEELVIVEVNDARDALESISGRRTSDDVLAHIFERFCIGK